MPFGGLLIGGIGAAGSLFGGLFGANASSQASKQYIAQLQKAQGYLQGLIPQATAPYAPWLSAGSQATNELSGLLSTPGEGLLTPWTQTFQAPTAAQAEQTPGYQFQLQQGENALQNSAAGKGSLLTGRTLADVNNYAQGVASTNYQNTFNNALTQYQSAYNTFLNNQNNTYSRLLGLSGEGLGAAQGTSGAIQGIGGDIASLYGQQGAAQAQGTIGSANSLSGIFPGISGNLLNGLLLSKLGLGGGGGAAPGGTPPIFGPPGATGG